MLCPPGPSLCCEPETPGARSRQFKGGQVPGHLNGEDTGASRPGWVTVDTTRKRGRESFLWMQRLKGNVRFCSVLNKKELDIFNLCLVGKTL